MIASKWQLGRLVSIFLAGLLFLSTTASSKIVEIDQGNRPEAAPEGAERVPEMRTEDSVEGGYTAVQVPTGKMAPALATWTVQGKVMDIPA